MLKNIRYNSCQILFNRIEKNRIEYDINQLK